MAPNAKPKPSRTQNGYKCPLCVFEHEYAVQVWRHLHLEHAYKSGRHRRAKPAGPAAATDEPDCCSNPRWQLLDGRYPVQALALSHGYNEFCATCDELRR